jgi:hypothetical protein
MLLIGAGTPVETLVAGPNVSNTFGEELVLLDGAIAMLSNKLAMSLATLGLSVRCSFAKSVLKKSISASGAETGAVGGALPLAMVWLVGALDGMCTTVPRAVLGFIMAWIFRNGMNKRVLGSRMRCKEA